MIKIINRINDRKSEHITTFVDFHKKFTLEEVKLNTELYRKNKINKGDYFECFKFEFEEYDTFCLDIDIEIDEEDKIIIINEFSRLECCLLCTTTPSNKIRIYLKINKQNDFALSFLKISSNIIGFLQYIFTYNADDIISIFEKYAINIDTHYKSKAQWSFISYDSNVHFNIECDVLEIDEFINNLEEPKKAENVEYNFKDKEELKKILVKLGDLKKGEVLNGGKLDLSEHQDWIVFTLQTAKLIEMVEEYEVLIVSLWDYCSKKFCYNIGKYDYDKNYKILKSCKPKSNSISFWKKLMKDNGLIFNKEKIKIDNNYLTEIIYGDIEIIDIEVERFVGEKQKVIESYISNKISLLQAMPGTGKNYFTYSLPGIQTQYNPFEYLRQQMVQDFNDNTNKITIELTKKTRITFHENYLEAEAIICTYDAAELLNIDIRNNTEVANKIKNIDYLIIDEQHETIASYDYRATTIKELEKLTTTMKENGTSIVYLTATPSFELKKCGIEQVIRINRKKNSFDKINCQIVVSINRQKIEEHILFNCIDNEKDDLNIIFCQSKTELEFYKKLLIEIGGFDNSTILSINKKNYNENDRVLMLEKITDKMVGDGIRFILTTSAISAGTSFMDKREVNYIFIKNKFGNVDGQLIEQTVNRLREAKNVNVVIGMDLKYTKDYYEIYEENKIKLEKEIELLNKCIIEGRNSELKHFNAIYKNNNVVIEDENGLLFINERGLLAKSQKDFYNNLNDEDLKVYLKFLDNRWEFKETIYCNSEYSNSYKQTKEDLIKTKDDYIKKSNHIIEKIVQNRDAKLLETILLLERKGKQYDIDIETFIGIYFGWLAYKYYDDENVWLLRQLSNNDLLRSGVAFIDFLKNYELNNNVDDGLSKMKLFYAENFKDNVCKFIEMSESKFNGKYDFYKSRKILALLEESISEDDKLFWKNEMGIELIIKVFNNISKYKVGFSVAIEMNSKMSNYELNKFAKDWALWRERIKNKNSNTGKNMILDKHDKIVNEIRNFILEDCVGDRLLSLTKRNGDIVIWNRDMKIWREIFGDDNIELLYVTNKISVKQGVEVLRRVGLIEGDKIEVSRNGKYEKAFLFIKERRSEEYNIKKTILDKVEDSNIWVDEYLHNNEDRLINFMSMVGLIIDEKTNDDDDFVGSMMV